MRECPTLRWARRLQLAAIKGGEKGPLPFLLAPPETEGLGPDWRQNFLDGGLLSDYIGM